MSSAGIEAVLLEMAWAYANNSPATHDKVPWGEVRKGMRAALAAAFKLLATEAEAQGSTLHRTPVDVWLRGKLAELDALALRSRGAAGGAQGEVR